jgi:UDP-N-acetylmuramate--alanine ligase
MNKKYHLIGIGGIGMSGIAQLLLRKGFKVSGSDLKASKITDELQKLGAKIFIGHRPENVQGAQVVVYSSAIKQENPEIIEAARLGIPILKRAQALAWLMQDKTVITITGSHGKTTTASLAAYLLLEAGLLPSVAVGGILKNIDTNSYLGSGEFFVAEADESDGSFLYYRPKYSIITNIDREHLDYYKEFKNELDAFRKFLNKTEEGGCVFCCADDMNLRRILTDYKKRYVLFGLRDTADIYPKNILMKDLTSEFDCYCNNKIIPHLNRDAGFIDRFELSLGGKHNISNALSVIALALEIGIDLKFIKEALKNYKGAGRRLEIKFSDANYLVIDDYAHHPTEIRATLETVKNLKRNRIIAIFQPHRYTRTKLLQDEFGKSFDLADCVILTDIYAASESAIPGVNAKCIYDKIKHYTPDKEIVLLPKEQIAEHILNIIKPDDLVITLGAGDIVKVGETLAESLNLVKI